jgi:hypothetical protein
MHTVAVLVVPVVEMQEIQVVTEEVVKVVTVEMV